MRKHEVNQGTFHSLHTQFNHWDNCSYLKCLWGASPCAWLWSGQIQPESEALPHSLSYLHNPTWPGSIQVLFSVANTRMQLDLMISRDFFNLNNSINMILFKTKKKKKVGTNATENTKWPAPNSSCGCLHLTVLRLLTEGILYLLGVRLLIKMDCKCGLEWEFLCSRQ